MPISSSLIMFAMGVTYAAGIFGMVYLAGAL